MIVPTPLDPNAGDKLSQSTFDAGVRDVLNFLLNGYPRVHAWVGTALALSSGTARLMNMDSETYDTDSMHSTVTNNGRITFTTAGVYEVDIMIAATTATTYTSEPSLRVVLNGGGSYTGGTSLRTQGYTQPPNGSISVPQFRFSRSFDAGDYIEMWYLWSGTGTPSITNVSLASRVFARMIST